MKRSLVPFLVLILGLMTGCNYFQKKDEPPPLPPIEETKPPLKMKGEFFKAFPWSDLAKPRKDGNDPDTSLYTIKEGDTLDSVAEKEMGSPGLATALAEFNEISSPSSVSTGDKVVIPNPVIGVSSQLKVKGKGDKNFGSSESFDVQFKTGDHYQMLFESNVNGYLYVLREGAKEGVTMLFPAKAKAPVAPSRTKKGKKTKKEEPPLIRDTGKVVAHDPLTLPIGPLGTKGYAYDPKKVGDRVSVFFSLRAIPELEELKDKTKIKSEDVKDLMRRVKEGSILVEPPIHLLRVSEPSEILGFFLNING
jgi:hypothetical protein